MFYIIFQIWAFILFCIALFFFSVYQHNKNLNVNDRGELKPDYEIEADELTRMYH
jgi:hypothetical protein